MSDLGAKIGEQTVALSGHLSAQVEALDRIERGIDDQTDLHEDLGDELKDRLDTIAEKLDTIASLLAGGGLT